MNKKIIPDAWGQYKILKLSSIGAHEWKKKKQNQKTKKQKKTTWKENVVRLKKTKTKT